MANASLLLVDTFQVERKKVSSKTVKLTSTRIDRGCCCYSDKIVILADEEKTKSSDKNAKIQSNSHGCFAWKRETASVYSSFAQFCCEIIKLTISSYTGLLRHVLHSQFGSPDSASSRRSADPLLRACSSEVVLYRIYQASLASKLSHFLDVQLNRLVAATLAQTTLSATGSFSGRIIKGQRSQTAH
ncbi:hypothetical protein Tsp_08413 [Trichinella spiralis]|uniref:hypothetical protein n=1 Tax=Trichinella spiralis TaxID=6334 RepID=UPI0001EFB572|nr:hypothetical protein Tsp_08413 [Trichinella spiralis]